MKLHSFIDVITNSSSEIFINKIINIKEEELKEILKEIVNIIGCDNIEFEIYKERDDEDNIIENVLNISYVQDHKPCKIIKKMLIEIFNKRGIEYEE
jgi:hypothetical protein